MWENERRELKCNECGTKLKISTTIQRGYSDHEDVYCPECNSFIERIRADWGFKIKEVIKPDCK